MTILTPEEKEVLDVFLHEATTSPFFSGPATKALYALGVEYRDMSYLAWAYDRDVPRSSFAWGHSAEVAPALPWTTREAVLRRNQEIKRIWEQERKAVGAPRSSCSLPFDHRVLDSCMATLDRRVRVTGTGTLQAGQVGKAAYRAP